MNPKMTRNLCGVPSRAEIPLSMCMDVFAKSSYSYR